MQDITIQIKVLLQHQHVKNVEKENIQQKEHQHAQIVMMGNIQHPKQQVHARHVQQHVMEIVIKQPDYVIHAKEDMVIQVERVLNVMQDIMQQQEQHQHVKNVEKENIQQKEQHHALLVIMGNIQHPKLQVHAQHVQQHVMEIA